MPWASSTLSSAAAWSSQPSSYDMPEQPPPTTRIRSPHSGLPSSRRSSETFLAAVSVIVTITYPPVDSSFSDEEMVSQDALGGQEGQLLERGVGRQRRHQDGGPRNILCAQHFLAGRCGPHAVPDRRVDRPGDQHPHPYAVGPELLGQDPAEGLHGRLGGRVDGAAGQRPLGGDGRQV